jgi:putative transposase
MAVMSRADPTVPVQMLTFKCRLLSSRGQHDKLRAALDHTRDLYNSALAERIECYRKTGKGRSWQDQCKGLTELRADPAWTTYPVTLQRWPLKQVDLAFAAFFRRVKAKNGKAGFPRFRGHEWFKTFGFSDRSGWGVTGARLRMKGIGSVRIHLHRPLPSVPIACKVKREGRHWYALLTVEALCATEHVGPAVGIDVGLTTLAALSTGEMIANPRPARRAEREMRRRQRQLSRCKRGSKRRRKVKARLATMHAKIARTRETHLHQVSADLTRRFGVIAVEKLNIKGLASAMLAKEVHDVAWGRFNEMLRYKAAKAGSRLVEVDPRGTSQTCPDCGIIKRKELSQRIHRCECGCVLDRDVAAARVILHRAGNRPGALNTLATVCALGKICEAA